MSEDSFFRHLMIGGILVIGGFALFIIGLLLIGLWQAGVITFIVTIGVIWGFCWVVHKLAASPIVKKWLKEL